MLRRGVIVTHGATSYVLRQLQACRHRATLTRAPKRRCKCCDLGWSFATYQDHFLQQEKPALASKGDSMDLPTCAAAGSAGAGAPCSLKGSMRVPSQELSTKLLHIRTCTKARNFDTLSQSFQQTLRRPTREPALA
jgi:hypothetical protein